MFFYVDILIAVLVALFIAALIVSGMRSSFRLGRYLSVVILFLLALWAGAVWITPADQDFRSLLILLSAVVGVIAALVLAIIAYPYYPLFQKEERGLTPQRSAINRPVGVFFWVLVVLLVMTIVVGYMLR